MLARRGTSSIRKILPYLGLTLLIHNFVILAGVVYYLVRPPTVDPFAQEERVDVALVDDVGQGGLTEPSSDASDIARAVAAAEEAEQKKQEEEQKKIEEAKSPHGQVVDLPAPAREEAPKDAKYVSEYNTKVERETKAPTTGKPGAAPGPLAPPAPPEPPPQAQAQPTPAGEPGAQPTPPAEPGPLAMRSRRQSEAAPAGQGSLEPPELAPDGLLPQSGAPGVPDSGGAKEQGAPTAPPVGGSRLSLQDLMPSDRQLARTMSGGGGGTLDYLKDVEEGEGTALNSKKWKFASFFNRIKRTVAEHWKPGIEYRRRDPSGNVYGMRDRITVLRVSLKPDGSLARVTVEQPSGVDFLDDEAMTAFQQAQPFPNPPRQLVDESGMIQFRFAFIFEISSTPSFKVFRYN